MGCCGWCVGTCAGFETVKAWYFRETRRGEVDAFRRDSADIITLGYYNFTTITP